jgi:hypothetical protein
MIPARAAVAGIRGTIGATAGDLVIIGAGVVRGIRSPLLRPEAIEILTQPSPAIALRDITIQSKTRLIASRFPSRLLALAGRSLAGVGGAVPRGQGNRAALLLLLVLLEQPRRLLALPPIGLKMGVVCPLRVPRGNCGLIVAGNAKRFTAHRQPPQDCHRGPWRNLQGCLGGSGRS